MLIMTSMKTFLIICIASLGVKLARSLSCASGYGSDVRVIPSSWINDGYCDCPMDGIDETTTSACSGSSTGGWAGSRGVLESRYVFIDGVYNLLIYISIDQIILKCIFFSIPSQS
jgi:hypothetical protein